MLNIISFFIYEKRKTEFWLFIINCNNKNLLLERKRKKQKRVNTFDEMVIWNIKYFHRSLLVVFWIGTSIINLKGFVKSFIFFKEKIFLFSLILYYFFLLQFQLLLLEFLLFLFLLYLWQQLHHYANHHQQKLLHHLK